MASYHTSFSYNDKNSAKDMGLIIASFEPDEGFKESFLSMDNVSDDYFDGTKRFDYGSKYNTSASIEITVIKKDGSDMKLEEFRAYAKWLTGSKIDSWLDMYVGDSVIYSFLGKFTNLEHYKMDARTIGIRLTFSSISPWAYSPPQVFDCSIYQVLTTTIYGVLRIGENDKNPLGVENNVVYPNRLDSNSCFNITDDGVAYLDTAYRTTIDNKSDDLYTYIYLDIDYTNISGDSFSVKNATLGEESIVTGMSKNESVSISAKQFITSDIPNKIFGDNFNFVWPRLQTGINDFIINGNGKGSAQFSYRYPMKVGDCVIDVDVYGGGVTCGDCNDTPSHDSIEWVDIINTPTTISGYGITDAYTMNEVDTKIDNIDISSGGSESANVDDEKLYNMLEDVLG